MQRKQFDADLILTADWHLREDSPVCRTDDIWEAEWNKVAQIVALNLPILHAGDLFNKWNGSPRLISQFILHILDDYGFKQYFKTVYGNHDLPQHNLDLFDKTALHTLEVAGALDVVMGGHWGQEPDEASLNFQGRSILLWHVMTFKGKKPWPGCTDLSAKQILRKYPMYDLIVTGHNHKSFTEEYQGRILVNPGSILRMSADQYKSKPCVYLYNAKQHAIKRHILTYNSGCISRVHLQQQRTKKQRYTAFMRSVQAKTGKQLKFEDNLEMFFKQHNTAQEIKQCIYDSMEK